jgi:hypothetical protein
MVYEKQLKPVAYFERRERELNRFFDPGEFVSPLLEYKNKR